MVLNEIFRSIQSALGELSPTRARELAASLMPGQGKDQITKTAQDLMEWSSRNRERLTELVRAEMRSQLKQVGLASRDEVDALRRRVRELEKAQGGQKRSTAVRKPAKRPTAASTATP